MNREELEKAGKLLAEFDETEVHDRFYAGKVIALRALAGSLLMELSAKAEGDGMEKEYATYSPNARAHAKMNIMNHGDVKWDVKLAHEFAEIYLDQSVTGGIHGDADAAAVWRWVGEWEFMEGYPKTREQVEAMIKEKEEKS